MLQQRTVLILGAGASVDFGFPTGAKLSKRIYDETAYGSHGHVHLGQLGHEREYIESFRNAFYYSGKNSIDAFLEHNIEFSDIGKAAILSILGRCESPDALFNFENNWLRYLYGQLNTSFQEFGSHDLSIITYNYDRSVETFFYTALKYTYHRSDEETLAVVSKIPIVHLHGTLGKLQWQDSASRSPYTPEITPEKLRAGVANIKIIHEEPTDRDSEFRQAKSLLASAERVMFIGFGYDRTNLARLDIPKMGPRHALGSCVGMSAAEKKRAAKYTEDRLHFLEGNCLDFMKDYMPWQT